MDQRKQKERDFLLKEKLANSQVWMALRVAMQ